MTGKERVRIAFDHREPDRVPLRPGPGLPHFMIVTRLPAFRILTPEMMNPPSDAT